MCSLKSRKKCLKENSDNSSNLVNLEHHEVKSNRILNIDKLNLKNFILPIYRSILMFRQLKITFKTHFSSTTFTKERNSKSYHE